MSKSFYESRCGCCEFTECDTEYEVRAEWYCSQSPEWKACTPAKPHRKSQWRNCHWAILEGDTDE